MSLAGRVVIVTGAGSGIGRAVARVLAADGASVVLFGRRAALLRELRDELACPRGGPDRAVQAVPLDVTSPAAVADGVETVLQHFRRLDGLVNNAGLARFGRIDEVPLSDLDRMIDVNVRGPVNLIRACLPALRENDGSIVNVTSVGGSLAMPERSLYGATKAALNSLTRSLARELAPRVRVNAVLPGPVETPMYADLGLTVSETSQLKQDLLRATPMSRFAEPHEIAGWIRNLLDNEISGWVTGVLLPIDGGRTA